MPFLFLGLLRDENQGEASRTGAAATTSETTLKTELLQGQQIDEAAADPTTPVSDSALPAAIEELRMRISAGLNPGFRVRTEGLLFGVNNSGGVPTFATFKFGYLPGRGLLYSAIAHELVLFGVFLLITYGLPVLRSEKLIVRLNTQDSHTILLPEIGGGTEGQKSPGGGQSAPQPPAAAPAHLSKGFAYPGAQAILSDPPNPTNVFQTIQRPLLVHPELIHKLIPLPNVVHMAETRLPNDVVAPKPAMPQLHETPKAIQVKQDSSTHRDAKWKVPVNDAPKLIAKTEMPKLPAAEQPMPEAPKVQVQPKQEEEKREAEKPSPNPLKVTAEKRAEKSQKQTSPPSPAQVARLEMHGKDLEPLLSLSPMPLPPGADVKIPSAEARGRFAIAPGGTLNPNAITPGKSNGTPSTSPATGQENLQGPNAATDSASNAGNGAGHNASAGGGSGNSTEGSGAGSAGSGTGAGDTSGAGAGGPGTGMGRGSSGKGAGKGTGRGAGSGSGGGSGSGTGSFPGITIQGGEETSANSNAPSYTIEPQAGYGMTVVSTASSGGGLEDFGVFANERVFTVYIPMKRSPEEDDPTWTLQYALLKDDAPNPAGDQTVLAPAPVMREWPQISADLEKKYAHQQVVIYAIVDQQGKVSHVTVKQTPDARVSDPIAKALAKWVFRPAQVGSQPARVKILVGIPL